MTTKPKYLYYATISEQQDDSGLWTLFFYTPGERDYVYAGSKKFSDRNKAVEAKQIYEQENNSK